MEAMVVCFLGCFKLICIQKVRVWSWQGVSFVSELDVGTYVCYFSVSHSLRL